MRGRWSKWAVRIMLCLALGAGCEGLVVAALVYRDVKMPNRWTVTRFTGYAMCSDGRTRFTEHVHRFGSDFWLLSEDFRNPASADHEAPEPPPWWAPFHEEKYDSAGALGMGWPLRCLKWEEATRIRSERPGPGVPVFERTTQRGAGIISSNYRPGWHVVPLIPIWPGLLVDAGLFAFIPLVVVGLCTSCRRWRRRRAGRCAACGYDLRGIADACPECGQTRV